MDINASYSFDAPVDQVWNLLMDPEAVGKCLPGSRGLKEIAPDRYEVELGLAIAAIAGNFKGTVAIEEKNPPQSYKLAVEGTGRQGFVKGFARITLEPDGARTHVRVAAQADVGGMIARVGQRLLEGVARTTMDRFYGCLANGLSQRSV
jgi:carbon monoxide dehydrogenase subunit G